MEDRIMTESHDWKAMLQKELEPLTKLRDELRVQMHLAKAELKQDWDKLEGTFLHIQDELKYTGEQSKQPARELSAAARALLDELKRGYDRVTTGLREQVAQVRHEKPKES
jgi:hypothetical protein